MWTTNDQGEMDEDSWEYRYCEKCQQASGITFFKHLPDADLDFGLFDPMEDLWEDGL